MATFGPKSNYSKSWISIILFILIYNIIQKPAGPPFPELASFQFHAVDAAEWDVRCHCERNRT